MYCRPNSTQPIRTTVFRLDVRNGKGRNACCQVAGQIPFPFVVLTSPRYLTLRLCLEVRTYRIQACMPPQELDSTFAIGSGGFIRRSAAIATAIVNCNYNLTTATARRAQPAEVSDLFLHHLTPISILQFPVSLASHLRFVPRTRTSTLIHGTWGGPLDLTGVGNDSPLVPRLPSVLLTPVSPESAR